MSTAMSTRGEAGPFVRMIRTRIELWMVVMIMAMSFGAGIIVRTIAEPPATPAALPLTDPGFQVAPPLTDEQMTEGLPEGHPSTSGDGSEGTGGGGQGGGNQSEENASP